MFMNIVKSFLINAIVVSTSTIAFGQTQVVAHRGYWNKPGSAQNSITSLYNAYGVGVYGSEIDVQLSADDELIVNHDPSIQGHVIARSTSDSLSLLRLDNGEPLPTLTSYLKALRCCPDLKLVLEIKPHASQREEELAVRLVVDRVRAFGLDAQTEYISFSHYICRQIVSLDSTAQVSYLGSDTAPASLANEGIRGIDYHYAVLLKNPVWVKEAHDSGMKVNVWTVNDMDVAQKLIDMGVDYITTDAPSAMRDLCVRQKWQSEQ